MKHEKQKVDFVSPKSLDYTFCHIRYWYGEIEKNKWSDLSVRARLRQLEHLQRCLDNAVCDCGFCPTP